MLATRLLIRLSEAASDQASAWGKVVWPIREINWMIRRLSTGWWFQSGRSYCTTRRRRCSTPSTGTTRPCRTPPGPPSQILSLGWIWLHSRWQLINGLGWQLMFWLEGETFERVLCDLPRQFLACLGRLEDLRGKNQKQVHDSLRWTIIINITTEK